MAMVIPPRIARPTGLAGLFRASNVFIIKIFS
jgi:hypothetical protein